MQKAVRQSLIAICLVGVAISLRYAVAHRVEPSGILHVERPLMGMVWKMDVVAEGRPEAACEAVETAFRELDRIDRLMSDYKKDSPLSAVNEAAGKTAVAVPDELVAILQRSNGYSERSGGAFDITFRGMKRIWKLNDSFIPPTDEQVKRALRNVNYREIAITGRRVGLPREGMSIGLGGIAAGYGVDRAVGILRSAGFRNFLVDGSGDMFVSGTKHGRPWRLGVQHPREERGRMIGVAELSDRALATSGDYERFRMVNGVRYHHIIDARSGYPARLCRQVTVIAPTTEQADALSTTIFVLGPVAGLSLAQQEGVDVWMIDAEGREHRTPGLSRWIVTSKENQ